MYLLRENILPPDDFEASSRRKTREANQQKEMEGKRRQIVMEDAYHDYCRVQVRAHLDSLSEDARLDLVSQKMREIRRQWGHLPPSTIEELANRQLENELRQKLTLLSFEEFSARNPQQSLFD